MTSNTPENSPNSLPASDINSSGVPSKAKIGDPLPWIVMTLALIFDQLTKWQVIENLAVDESWPATGFFRFTHAWNTGTAFSLFQGQGDTLMWVSLGAVVVLTWIYRSIDDPPWVLRIAFGLQFGGAIGNIVDRIRLGHVTDFIDIGTWPVFNIADSSIVVGISLMIFYFWFLDKKSPAEEETPVAAASAGVNEAGTADNASEPTSASSTLDSPE